MNYSSQELLRSSFAEFLDEQCVRERLAAASNQPVSSLTCLYAVAASGWRSSAGADRRGMFSKSEPSPSAIVGCARMAARSF
jgi:hypothetical protein